MTKREPVAFDLAEVGGRGASTAEDHRLVRRPVLSVPDNRVVGGAAAAAQPVSRMTSPAPDQGFQSLRNNSSHVTRPGVGRPLRMAGRLQADSGSEDNSSITIDSSLKKEDTEGPSASAWDRSAPVSTLNRHEDSALAQQAGKAAFMYGSPLQELRPNVARTNSASRDEAELGAHKSSILLGTEPSSSHSAWTSGSPVPLYKRMKGNSRFENGVQSTPPQQQQEHPIQGANITAGHAIERPTGTGKHPSTAQLTVFYAGMVNVYDDVPLDKAQAIMLLAGAGSAWSSSNYTNLPGSYANSGRPSPNLGGMNHTMSRAGSPAPQLAVPSSGPSLGAVAKLPNRPQVTTAVELPQARKASLARFLEKRKDRVRKGPYTHPNDEAARNDALRRNSRENSPSHPHASAKPPRQSLCPPAAGNRANDGSKPNSSPQTPPRRSMSEDRSHGMLARKEYENSNSDAVVSRSEKSSPSR